MAIPKKPLIIAGSIVLVLIIGLAATAFAFRDEINRYFNPEATPVAEQPSTSQPVVSQEVIKASQEAIGLSVSGDTDAAVGVLDAAIEQTDSNVNKSALLGEKANLLVATDPDAALEAALEALELDESLVNTTRVAQYYADRGENQLAIDYYNQALEIYDQIEFAEDGRQSDRNNFLEAIEALR